VCVLVCAQNFSFSLYKLKLFDRLNSFFLHFPLLRLQIHCKMKKKQTNSQIQIKRVKTSKKVKRIDVEESSDHSENEIQNVQDIEFVARARPVQPKAVQLQAVQPQAVQQQAVQPQAVQPQAVQPQAEQPAKVVAKKKPGPKPNADQLPVSFHYIILLYLFII
jgi:hypothetical protein